MQDKLKLLCKIAKLFNDGSICWCVDGSMLLLHIGLGDEPNDIDIVVHKDDVQKAIGLMQGIGEEKDVHKSSVFVSDIYKKFVSGGIEVDLIAGFKVRHEGGIYEYKPDFAMPISIDEVMYAKPEDWAKLYSMMPGKKGKADVLRKCIKMDVY